jgi:hypothetical protein
MKLILGERGRMRRIRSLVLSFAYGATPRRVYGSLSLSQPESGKVGFRSGVRGLWTHRPAWPIYNTPLEELRGHVGKQASHVGQTKVPGSHELRGTRLP